MTNLTQQQMYKAMFPHDKNSINPETIEFKQKLNSTSFSFTAKTTFGADVEFTTDVTATGRVKRNSVYRYEGFLA